MNLFEDNVCDGMCNGMLQKTIFQVFATENVVAPSRNASFFKTLLCSITVKARIEKPQHPSSQDTQVYRWTLKQ